MKTRTVTLDVPDGTPAEVARSGNALEQLQAGFLTEILSLLTEHGLGEGWINGSTQSGIVFLYQGILGPNHRSLIIFYNDGYAIMQEANSNRRSHLNWASASIHILEFVREQIADTTEKVATLEKLDRRVAILNE